MNVMTGGCAEIGRSCFVCGSVAQSFDAMSFDKHDLGPYCDTCWDDIVVASDIDDSESVKCMSCGDFGYVCQRCKKWLDRCSCTGEEMDREDSYLPCVHCSPELVKATEDKDFEGLCHVCHAPESGCTCMDEDDGNGEI